MLFQTILLKEF